MKRSTCTARKCNFQFFHLAKNWDFLILNLQYLHFEMDLNFKKHINVNHLHWLAQTNRCGIIQINSGMIDVPEYHIGRPSTPAKSVLKKKKETELYNPTYGTAPLIIRFDFEFKILYYEICCTYALHMYRTNLYVSIFQSLINSDQFYREVNQWYGTGTVSYCTVRYVTWWLSFYRRVIIFRIRIYRITYSFVKPTYVQ